MRNVGILVFVTSMLVLMMFPGSESKKMTLDEVKSAVKALRKTCMPKTGVPKELVENAAKGNFVPDRKLKCYQECVLTMIKLMKNGKMRVNVMIQQADILLYEEDAQKVKAVVEACIGKISSEDSCDAAYELYTCFYEQNKEIYFLP